MINQYVVSGNLGKKPEFKKFDSGKTVARFPLAVNQYSKSNEQPEPLWLDIECWDGVAERLQKCELDKGKHITVVGAIAPNVYQEQIGDKTITHRRVKVKMMTFELAGKKATEATEQELVLSVNEAPTTPKPLSAAKTFKLLRK